MNKRRRRTRRVRPAVLRKALASFLELPLLVGGRLVGAVWMSPRGLSDESRERLHAYLRETYDAVGVRSDVL